MSSERPLISVVIPTHQRAPLLERSLESLTAQTLPPSEFEVVVVDDGSSDWTGSVCARLAERLPLRYFRIESSGIAAAKNLGLFAADAPLVLFFDDDDVADASMIETHLEAHRAHPEESVAVLGHTTWAPELELTPLMTYVTEIGQMLFSYPSIPEGEPLDHTYFWGGRSSCKRSFLTEHGSFDQSLPAMEDIELGFRLSRHGLSVVYAPAAKSFMIRAVTYDEFAQRCVKRGRALWLYNNLHADEAVKRYCRVAEGLETWSARAPLLDAKVDRVHELERLLTDEGGLDEGALGELNELYRWTFDAFQARGIADTAAEMSEQPGERRARRRVAPGRLPAICPDPVFIIGSPRSGTSALAWALAQHSELWTEAESDIFYYLFKDAHIEAAFDISVARPDGTWLRNRGVDREQFLEYLGLGLNALLTKTSNGKRWIDQTPTNTVVVDQLADLFPGASFVHILRDGRRVVHSMMNFTRAFGDEAAIEQMKASGRLPPWATDFADACQTWARLVDAAAGFCRRNPERAFTVSNERLITEPDEAMGELLEFLGVRDEPGPAHFLRTQRINSSFAPSGGSAQAPPELTQPWLDWSSQEREIFFDVAGEMMIACGLASDEELRGLVADRTAPLP